MSSIAKETGFLWRTLWNLPDNAQLKGLRQDPNALLPGDVVVIPALRAKEVSKATDQTHQFVRKGDPCRLKLHLLRSDGRPRANLTYTLQLDGAPFAEGETDADGYVEHFLPATAREAALLLHLPMVPGWKLFRCDWAGWIRTPR